MDKGMYIRVPLDNQEKYNRYFKLSQITEIINGNVHYKSHDYNKNMKMYSIAKKGKAKAETLERAYAPLGSKIRYKNILYTVRGHNLDKNMYVIYTLVNNNIIENIPEYRLNIPFNIPYINPVKQLKKFEFHNPIYYLARKKVLEVSKNLEFSSFGFSELYSSRVFLYKHQIDTIITALKMDNCRLMLADEVGLGKTIQASVILKVLLKKNLIENVLILVPEHLKKQWENELYTKFWLDTDKDSCLEINSISNYLKQNGKSKYDFVIIDEIHNYIENNKTFDKFIDLSRNSKNIIILSATPIQKRNKEYKKMLSILEPKRFLDMSKKDFTNLLEKQDKIREDIYEIMLDLDNYDSDEFIRDEIEFNLKLVISNLDDNNLNKLYKNIDESTNIKEKLYNIKKILSYISTEYQFERRIIRHRKDELIEEYAKRKLKIIDLIYSEDNKNRNRVKNELLDYFNYLKDGKIYKKEIIIEIIKNLYKAFYSSPHQLKEEISQLKKNSKYNFFIIDSELKKWMGSIEKQLNDPEMCFSDPFIINNKIMYLMDYIDQNHEFEKIFVIFSCKKTLDRTLRIIKKLYRPKVFSSFIKNNDEITKNENIYKFQNSKNCRILLSDESGGEGKNLQMADTIIHYDLSWDPSEIEQRIGRLDRIGRKKEKEIKSVLFLNKESVDRDLFNIWNDVFNIYNNSISGLEIAISDINKKINKSIFKDFESGLYEIKNEIKNYYDEIKKIIKREKFFDLAKSLDPITEQKYNELIRKFNVNNNSKLIDSIKMWGKTCGFFGFESSENDKVIIFTRNTILRNIKSLTNSLFPIPDFSEINEHSKSNQKIVGTFERELAVKRESNIFFVPGNPIFDSIYSNSLSNYKGRTTALRIFSDFKWEGFEIVWTIEIDYQILAKYKINYRIIEPFLDILNNPIYREFSSVDRELKNKETEKIDQIFNDFSIEKLGKNYIYIGSRHANSSDFSNENQCLEDIMDEYDTQEWDNLLTNIKNKSRKNAKKHLVRNCNSDYLINTVEEQIIAAENSSEYFNYKLYRKDISSLKKLKNMMEIELTFKVVIDSIAYIEVHNQNE